MITWKVLTIPGGGLCYRYWRQSSKINNLISLVKMDSKKLYRVRFQDQSERKTVEVVVESVEASEFMGLVVLEEFVFSDQKKLIIMPEEDEARQRFCKTERFHVPFHSIVYIEEFTDQPADLKRLPFVREVTEHSDQARKPNLINRVDEPNLKL